MRLFLATPNVNEIPVPSALVEFFSHLLFTALINLQLTSPEALLKSLSVFLLSVAGKMFPSRGLRRRSWNYLHEELRPVDETSKAFATKMDKSSSVMWFYRTPNVIFLSIVSGCMF